MAKTAAPTASATGISNTLDFAAELYSTLFAQINQLEHDPLHDTEDGGLEEQLADLASGLSDAIDAKIVKGNDSKLTGKYSESNKDEGYKDNYSESGSISGSNLKYTASAPAFWTAVTHLREEGYSTKDGTYSMSESLKRSFSAKLQDYSPDQDGPFKISEFSGSRVYKRMEKDTDKEVAYAQSETNTDSYSFKGLYERHAGATDHIKINSFNVQGSIIETDTDTDSTPHQFTGSLQLSSKDFSYDATDSDGDQVLLSNGSGTVDQLKFALKDNLDGTNWSYTGNSLKGADLTTGDITDLAAALFAGNDKITGTAGDDDIMGFAGNDTIIGGLGADTLSGGSGNDTFVIGKADSTLDAHDVITDFNIGDVLKMGGKAVIGKSYTILSSTYNTLDAAKGAADGVIVKKGYVLAYVDEDTQDGEAGSSFLFHDLSGDGTADQMIELVGITLTEVNPAAIA